MSRRKPRGRFTSPYEPPPAPPVSDDLTEEIDFGPDVEIVPSEGKGPVIIAGIFVTLVLICAGSAVIWVIAAIWKDIFA